MEIEKLLAALNHLHPISEAFKNELIKEVSVLSLPKNHVLLEAPKVSEFAYFLDTGFAIAYRYIDGNRNINGIWQEGDFVFLHDSFFNHKPSDVYLQLITQATVNFINYPSMMRLFENTNEAHLLYQKIIHRHYQQCMERNADLHNLSTNDRYRKLIDQYPSIEQLLSQESIASYLGIKPQSLSRIKRKNSRPR